MKPLNIVVLGDGGWGTTLAVLLDSNQHKVKLWSNFPKYARLLNRRRENIKFLPGVKIPDSIMITARPEVVQEADLIVVAVPTQYIRAGLAKIKPYYLPKCPLVSVAKGLEQKTLTRPSEIIKEVLATRKVAVLSGPSHSEEVSRGCPASVVVASRSKPLAQKVQQVFMNKRFRVYTHSDMIGIELAGALKNIIAIAAGVCDGLKLGDNAKSALLARGLVEIARLGVAMGARKSTFFGLAGLGDLVTTCISPHSRNRAVGIKLAQGKSLKQILESMVMVAEGVWTIRAALSLAKKNRIEMPITAEVKRVLYDNKDPGQAVTDLMTRLPKSETEDLG